MAESSSNRPIYRNRPPIYRNRNLVLVGRTGNGKSATGNSIIGRKVFESRACAAGVTQLCQLATTKFKSGRSVNVIDTPGFFDFSSQSGLIADEVIKCVDKVKDGIHAFLLVFSIRTRFSKEEEAVIDNLRMLFGEKVLRYMIVVFTGGDDLKESDITFENYLGYRCPPPLEKIIRQTQNGCVVFDNRTANKNEKDAQLQKLITTVDTAILRNRGRPFMDDLINLQARVIQARENVGIDAERAKQLEENMKKFMKEVVSRHRAQILMLETQLAKAEEARMWAERQHYRRMCIMPEGTMIELRRRYEATERRGYELEMAMNWGGGDGGCSIV